MEIEQPPMEAKDAAAVRPSLPSLASYFLLLGATGFGGPIALAAAMQRALVEERRWITRQDYLDGLAFAQLAPGPMAAQLAMYLGHVHHGTRGATATGLAFVAPSFGMVVAISYAYVAYGGLPWVQALFYGVAPAVIGVIAVGAGRLARRVVGPDRLLRIIFLVMAVATAVFEQELVSLFMAAGFVTVALRGPNAPWLHRSPTLLSALPILPLPGMAAATSLFWFFAKAGLFVFGSGLAIVPFMYDGVVQEHRWLTDQQFLDAVAIAMITPGPVVITVAFIGFQVDGIAGAFAAAAGVFLPVYGVVVLFAPLYKRRAAGGLVRHFVAGVTAAASGAIAGAVVVLARRSIFDPATAAIALLSLLAIWRWRLPEPLVIAAAGALGLVLYIGRT